MPSFKTDPYLWVHFAGIAAVPICLELCLIGLSTGAPLLPLWFELLLVGSIGILPVFWMQWQRPFYIFSLPFLVLKPSRLTETQRQILHRFRTPVHRGLALVLAGVIGGLLWGLYNLAPIALDAIYLPIHRGIALVLAAIALLGSHLFLQVSLSVLLVLLTPPSVLVATPPHPATRISLDFTAVGIPMSRLLPPILPPPAAPAPTAEELASTESEGWESEDHPDTALEDALVESSAGKLSTAESPLLEATPVESIETVAAIEPPETETSEIATISMESAAIEISSSEISAVKSSPVESLAEAPGVPVASASDGSTPIAPTVATEESHSSELQEDHSLNDYIEASPARNLTAASASLVTNQSVGAMGTSIPLTEPSIESFPALEPESPIPSDAPAADPSANESLLHRDMLSEESEPASVIAEDPSVSILLPSIPEAPQSLPPLPPESD